MRRQSVRCDCMPAAKIGPGVAARLPYLLLLVGFFVTILVPSTLGVSKWSLALSLVTAGTVSWIGLFVIRPRRFSTKVDGHRDRKEVGMGLVLTALPIAFLGLVLIDMFLTLAPYPRTVVPGYSVDFLFGFLPLVVSAVLFLTGAIVGGVFGIQSTPHPPD